MATVCYGHNHTVHSRPRTVRMLSVRRRRNAGGGLRKIKPSQAKGYQHVPTSMVLLFLIPFTQIRLGRAYHASHHVNPTSVPYSFEPNKSQLGRMELGLPLCHLVCAMTFRRYLLPILPLMVLRQTTQQVPHSGMLPPLPPRTQVLQ